MSVQSSVASRLGHAAEGDLRLVGRVDVNGFATGALQLYHDGGFAAVCATDFGTPDAAVACRQLGFASGVAIRPLPASISEVDAIDLAQVRPAPVAIRPLPSIPARLGPVPSQTPVRVISAGPPHRKRPGSRSLFGEESSPHACLRRPASRMPPFMLLNS